MHDSTARLGVAYAALEDAARTLVGASAAGPLGLALIQLRAAMNAVNAELVAESAAERQLAECDPYQVALAMSASGMPETVDGRSLWEMSAPELAWLAVTGYPDGAVALLTLVSDPGETVAS